MLALKVEDTFYIDLQDESFFLVDRIIQRIISIQSLDKFVFVYDTSQYETTRLLSYYKVRREPQSRFYVFNDIKQNDEYFFDQFNTESVV